MTLRLVVCACVLASAAVSAQGLRVGKVAIRGSVTPAVECLIVSPLVWPEVTEGVTAPTVTIETSGCVEDVVFTVSSGMLPTGIIESSDGVFSDDPMAAHSEGTTAITITATDDDSNVDTQDYSIVIGATDSGLPTGWESGDIGSIGNSAGTVTYDDNGDAGESVEDIWTLTSTAPNIIGTSDSFRYACKAASGDVTIIANISGLTGYTFAQAGVMIRKDLSPTAPHLFAFLFPTGGGLTMQRKHRLTDSATTTNENSGVTGYTWLRVSRVGDVLTAYGSTTGAADSWVQAGTAQTVDLDDSARVCLAVTSIVDQSTVADADFENVTVTAAPPIVPEDADYGGLRPHYQGFAATSLGGAGDATKVICIVTSRLSTSGPPGAFGSDGHYTSTHYHGTFKQCAAGMDTSYVFFDVSGYIEIGGVVRITYPYLTIAGQTAPQPGIALRNGYLQIDNRDIVVQHVRIRCGVAAGAVDGFRIGESIAPGGNAVFNTVGDHLSISWCGHEGIGINATPVRPKDILIVDTINAEHLTVISPSTTTGTLTFGNVDGTLTYARNLHSNVGNRNPWIGSGWDASVYNNVVYNAETISGGDGQFGFVQVVGVSPYPASLIRLFYGGNVNIAGPDTVDPDGTIKVTTDAAQVTAGGVEMYLTDNTGPGITGATQEGQWAGVSYISPAARNNSECDQSCYDSTSTFDWHKAFNFDILPNASVQAFVIANAGAYPAWRDALDSRVVGDVTDGGGSANTPNESAVGGFAAVPLAETTTTYEVIADPFGAGACGTKSSGTARTKLECALETAARALEPRWN